MHDVSCLKYSPRASNLRSSNSHVNCLAFRFLGTSLPQLKTNVSLISNNYVFKFIATSVHSKQKYA